MQHLLQKAVLTVRLKALREGRVQGLYEARGRIWMALIGGLALGFALARWLG